MDFLLDTYEVGRLPEGFLPEEMETQRPRIFVDEDVRYFGQETYEVTPLLLWTLKPTQCPAPIEGQKPVALTVGDGTGFKAMHFAQQGVDAVIIDPVEPEYGQELVGVRNARLAYDDINSGRLSLCGKFFHEANDKEIIKLCGGRKPPVITAFNVAHFMEFQEIETMFRRAAKLTEKGAIFSLSYEIAKDPETTITHDPEKIKQMAKAHGFIIEYFEDNPLKSDPTTRVIEMGFRNKGCAKNQPSL